MSKHRREMSGLITREMIEANRRPHICLNMIVKDESDIIEDALTSAALWIDSYCILDTGSTDDTILKIESFFFNREIPGVIHKGEFRNFSQARNEAINHAVNYLDDEDATASNSYLLFMDADMQLNVHYGKEWRTGLTADAYMVEQQTVDGFRYSNYRLMRWDNPARYVGATHEYLNNQGTGGTIEGIHFLDYATGSNRAEKYQRDLRLLTEAWQEDPTDTRAVFYLAQTYRDMGDWTNALNHYRLRAALGGWDEEVWYSTFQMAAMVEHLGKSPVDGYLAAWNLRPTRAEPLAEVARYYRERQQGVIAAKFTEWARSIPVPDDVLFVDTKAYG